MKAWRDKGGERMMAGMRHTKSRYNKKQTNKTKKNCACVVRAYDPRGPVIR
jgi:hypothetical protein